MTEPEKMTDSEKEKSCKGEAECLNRRQFFVALGAGSLAVAGAGACAFALQYISPNVLYEPSPIVNVGKPERYPIDSVTLDPRFGLFVVRVQEGFYALSAVCTHLGCLTVWKPETGVIACPCHGSVFHRDGTNVSGPAPRALARLEMFLSDEGDLMVDRASNPPPQKEYIKA